MIFTENFVIEHADILDWQTISKGIDLNRFSDDFFRRFKRELVWFRKTAELDGFQDSPSIFGNRTITTEFAHKHEHDFNSKMWFKDGLIHRGGDLPAMITKRGHKVWFQKGKMHRVGKPALIYPNGVEYWYQHGKLHREDGPAAIWPGGGEEWYIHGYLHRDDRGPAVIYANGKKEYWRKGNKIK